MTATGISEYAVRQATTRFLEELAAGDQASIQASDDSPIGQICVDEIGLDSMDILELVLALEEQFGRMIEIDVLDVDWDSYRWGDFLADLTRAIETGSELDSADRDLLLAEVKP